MTAAVAARGRLHRRERIVGAAVPPLDRRLYALRTSLLALLLVTGGLVVHLVALSAVQQRAAQQALFDRFRGELATGVAPIGPTDAAGGAVEPGDPVAYLSIPAIGLRQVVVEGTTSSNLFAGPGHRRDTPLPGQRGVSVLMGRRAAFGGPFARLDDLEAGDTIEVTTGQGEYEFEVMGIRRDGDPLPAPLEEGGARITLATAAGTPFFPSGVLRVDAELKGEGDPGPATWAGDLPRSEQLFGTDRSHLWLLALWLEVLLAALVGVVWAWHRWGRPQAWVVGCPAVLVLSLFVAGHLAELLPNVL